MDRKRTKDTISYDDDIDDSWRNVGWAELPFFLAAARTGTFRAAAERLKVNHATVDRHIKALEAAYDVRLFDRKSRGVTLTAAGLNLLEKAKIAEGAVIDAKRMVSGLDSRLAGPVHLNMSSWVANYVLPPEMGRFRSLYPDIELKVSVSDRVEDLAKSPADVSYRAAWSVEDDVVGRKLYSYNAAVLASKDYVTRHWENRGPDGEGLHWIGKSTLWPNPELDKLDLFPKARRDMDVRDPILINQLLRQGHGMAIVPFGTLAHFPELTVVPTTPVVSDRSIWILLQTDLRHTARVRAVVEFLTDVGKRAIAMEDALIEQDYS
ncbi:MAG: LysR family transcriptional regulator [Boseongicola sp.]|nr:MAG: LysR family transcriptional regulator [Boseongicola sp.]